MESAHFLGQITSSSSSHTPTRSAHGFFFYLLVEFFFAPPGKFKVSSTSAHVQKRSCPASLSILLLFSFLLLYGTQTHRLVYMELSQRERSVSCLVWIDLLPVCVCVCEFVTLSSFGIGSHTHPFESNWQNGANDLHGVVREEGDWRIKRLAV